MYSPHPLYTPHQAFQGVKSSGLYTKNMVDVSCELFDLNFHPLEVFPYYCDPQLQVIVRFRL